MKVIILIICLTSSLTYAEDSVAKPLYSHDLKLYVSKALENKSSKEAFATLEDKVRDMTDDKIIEEAAECDLTKNNYLNDKRSINKLIDMVNSINEESLSKLSTEDIVVMLLEIKFRYDFQENSSRPDSYKLERFKDLLKKVSPIMMDELDKREAKMKETGQAKVEKIEKKAGFCTPNHDETACQTSDGRVYKLQTNLNQFSRGFLKELERSNSTLSNDSGKGKQK